MSVNQRTKEIKKILKNKKPNALQKEIIKAVVWTSNQHSRCDLYFFAESDRHGFRAVRYSESDAWAYKHTQIYLMNLLKRISKRK